MDRPRKESKNRNYLKFRIMKKMISKNKKVISILIFLLSLSNSSLAQSKTDVIETIKVSGVAEVYFTHQAHEKIRKIVTGKPSPEVIVDFKDGVLEVNTKGEAHNEVVEVYVSSLHLKNIVVEDAAQFHITNTIQSEILTITVDDRGSADLDVITNNLEIKMSGGDLTISGETNNCTILKLDGHERGTLNSGNLVVKQ